MGHVTPGKSGAFLSLFWETINKNGMPLPKLLPPGSIFIMELPWETAFRVLTMTRCGTMGQGAGT
jgi:hypothetical protein